MPHKRNPELCERVCGLARLIRGYSVTSLENITLWHERDISHSSTGTYHSADACLALDYSMNVFTSVMKGLNVYPKRMKQNMEITRGFIVLRKEFYWLNRQRDEPAERLQDRTAECDEDLAERY